MAKRPGGAMIQSAAPTRSQLIPLLSKWGELGTKSQLIPMFVTIVAVFMMFVYSGDTDTTIVEIGGDPQGFWYTSPFIVVVASYLTLLSLYFIYRLVGKKQSWMAMLACTAFTGGYIWLLSTTTYLNWMYEFFHGFLAGGEPDYSQPFFTLFYRHFVGTGFFEEIVKALPLLIMVFGATKFSPGFRKHFKIEEPLDGILFGAAAGGGFAVMETVGQYVSRNLVQTWEKLALDIAGIKHGGHIPHLDPHQAAALIKTGMAFLGTAPGVQLMIPRSLDQAFGHMAYSGYFGYFIGLSVLKPEKRWRILITGLLSSALPHALWDSVQVFDSQVINMVVALLSYGLLAAAILKAREISPNRGLLQPSVVFGNFGQAGEKPATVEAEWAPVPAAPAFAAAPAQGQFGPVYGEPAAAVQVLPPPVPSPMGNVLAPPPPNLPEGTPCLRIGPKYLIIVAGLRILDHQAPGLQAANPGGPVAEVTRNPNDPNILGLTNLSRSPWEVVTPNGSRRTIQTSQTVKLAQGTRIDFGPIDGEVR